MNSVDLRGWKGVRLGLTAFAVGCFAITPALHAQTKAKATTKSSTVDKPATPAHKAPQPNLKAAASSPAPSRLNQAAGDRVLVKAMFDAKSNRLQLLPNRRQAQGGVACSAIDASCQLPDQAGHGSGGTLLANNSDFTVQDNFTPANDGVINTICWWGGYFNFVAGADCGPGLGDDFVITYYNDDAGSVGSVLAGPFAIGTADAKAETGLLVGPLTEYEYEATHADVAVLTGVVYWVEIANNGAAATNCRGLWSSAPPGDARSFQDAALQDYDLAFSVSGTIGGCGDIGEACDLDCAVGSTAEGEPVCGDDYDDVTNGGCNSDTPSWTDLGSLPSTFCGQSGGFLVNNAPCTSNDECPGDCVGGMCVDPIESRDTDWYNLTLGAESYVQMTLESEFQTLAGFIDDQNHTCGDATFIENGAAFIGPCVATTLTACLPAGDWTVFVAPQEFGPNATPDGCGNNIYNLTVELADGGQGLGVCPTAQSVCNIEDGLQCQFPDQAGHGATGVVGATSDSVFGFEVADNVQSLAGGNITSVCWWGFYVNFDDGNMDCGPGLGADDFTVRYYNDAGGEPGTLIAEFGQGDFTAFDKIATSNVIDAGIIFDEYSFTASHAAVPTTAGQCVWVSVQGAGDPSGTVACGFLWSTAPPGDERGWQFGVADPLNDFDQALCVNTFIGPEGCELAGACCDDLLGTCVNDVNVNDCNGRFAEGTTCANLDPPCGSGACCDSSNGTCTDTLEGNCAGNFAAGVFCQESGGSFICNSGCDWDNGPGDPDLAAIASQLAADEFVAAGADNLIFKNPGCGIEEVVWYTANFNFQGRCSDDSPCGVGDPAACGGNAGDCTPGLYAGDPSDYDAIDVVLWTNGETAGDVKSDKITVNQPIPQSDVGGEPDTCNVPGIPGDCAPGQACFDNDGDGTPQCCLVSEIASVQPGTINDMDLQFVIEHTWQGDLVISLEKVGSGVGPVRIMNRPGKDDLHGAGFGPFGYGVPNFGDPTDSIPKLTIDDEAPNFIDINTYDGANPGIANYAGPAQSGGGADPAFVLDDFEGENKAGTWRIYVSDDFGVSDSGSLIQWGINFNNVQPVAKGPAGLPVEDLLEQFTCSVSQDCADQGVPACECVGGLCVFDPGGDNLGCGIFGPTGEYSGDTTQACTVNSGWTFDAYVKDGEPVEDSWVVTIPTGSCGFNIAEDEKYFISILPQLPFLPEGGAFYQTAWMLSQNADGNPGQSIFEALGAFPWQPIDGTHDLAFSTSGMGGGGDCTQVNVNDCGDSNNDGLRDDACAWYSCDGGSCNSLAKTSQADMGGQFGACMIDGTADGNDRFLALGCFGNAWPGLPCEVSPPTAINVDAGGAFGACALDGVCDGNDAFAALNSFGNNNTCDANCAPSPTAPGGDNRGPVVDVVDTTGLRLVAQADRARPGQTIAVDVYMTNGVKDLRGYQLHLGARGGKAGSLELIDIVIEDRPDAAYASVDGEWQAFNALSEQMVAGLDTPGIATERGAYLATFIYRVSREARGAFVVDVLHDDAAGSYRTFLFATPANGKIAIDSTSPATIVVGEARSH